MRIFYLANVLNVCFLKRFLLNTIKEYIKSKYINYIIINKHNLSSKNTSKRNQSRKVKYQKVLKFQVGSET